MPAALWSPTVRSVASTLPSSSHRPTSALGPLLNEPGFDSSSDLLIIVDDYALPLGTMRFRARGSAGGHNGLQSIEGSLGSQEYHRLRIGVGPLPDEDIDPADFVLGSFTSAESKELSQLMPLLVEAVDCWLDEGIEAAMNRYNSRVTGE
jgi:PTH1 family peptidyl-tRNA hydrolase